MAQDFVNRKTIQWFPGHMMKTLRSMEKKLPQVDAVIELLDARIPQSSLNPEIDNLVKHKPRVYILNKADLADKTVTDEWLTYLTKQESTCIAINSKQKKSASTAKPLVEKALDELLQRRIHKGMTGSDIRVMVTGIPNVGKSTFINNWVGAVRAKAADKPGVTRGEQWIRSGNFELLDMPGVLWKRFDHIETAINLALIGSIPNTLLDTEEMASGLLKQIATTMPNVLKTRYKLPEDIILPDDGYEILEIIGKKRGMLISGGEIDTERASIMILDEFRGGKLGRISFEKPPITTG